MPVPKTCLPTDSFMTVSNGRKKHRYYTAYILLHQAAALVHVTCAALGVPVFAVLCRKSLSRNADFHVNTSISAVSAPSFNSLLSFLMPKIRRSRVKLHDSAPGSARRDSATSPPDRLLTSLADNGSGGSPNDGVREHSTVSFRCGANRIQAHSGNVTAGARKHTHGEASVVPAAAAADQLGIAHGAINPMRCLSRGQRRRAEKRDAWLRKFDFPQYAKKLREEHQRQQQGDYQQEGPLTTFAPALRQQLHDGDASGSVQVGISATDKAPAGGRKRLTRRSIQHVAEKEIQQYNAVVAFPAFRASPLAVLKEHLQNTICLQHKKERNA